ncbi:NAC domain-containing protein [Canna indica]|uniref:NAC domain-containing protein n=1 Tax=Canna indica TaxID=4628 RepID=A0AAQ3QK31_9LILI|nr:NAC domain-containing protein [Canna indica]
MGEGSGNLPPGFRFFPSDEELVAHFLYRKAALLPPHPDIIPTVDHHQISDPWTLTGKALQGGNKSWYFFASRCDGESGGASENGYWDAVPAEDQVISSGNRDVGVKKTLHYYAGEGIRTSWVMHEYHLLDGVLGSTSRSRRKRTQPAAVSYNYHELIMYVEMANKWVVCRVHESAAPASLHDEVGGTELSCLDEVFLSLDDLDEALFRSKRLQLES